MDGGAWWATVHGVAKSQTWLSDFTFTFHFPALEKEMATHSSVLAWRIQGTGEPGGMLSMGSHRVGHDWSNLAHARKVMLKILQARLQYYVNCQLQMFKLCLGKVEEPEIKLPTSVGSLKKQGGSRKICSSALLIMPKCLAVWITTNWKILKEMGIPDHRTWLEKSVCRSKRNS